MVVTTAAGEPQDRSADLTDQPISEVRIEGLVRVDEQLVRNNLRAAVGDPFDWETVQADVQRLTRLAEFRSIDASAKLQPDQTVVVIYQVQEHAIVLEVQFVGNTRIADQELRSAVRLGPGDPRDEFLIQNARRAIERLYRERGHYLTTVSIDESQLDEMGVLIFRIIEGPRLSVRAIEFVGNDAMPDRQLMAQIKTRTAMFILRKGELDEERLADDVAALDRFYRDRGYLDVRVDYEIQISPDNREAKVIYHVDEGPQYILRRVRTERLEDGGPLRVFATEQIAAMIEIKPGGVYSDNAVRKSIEVIQDAYLRLGYLNLLNPQRSLHFVALRSAEDEPTVDLLISVDEGTRSRVGLIDITGNFLTRDKVIRRHVRLDPGRPFDGTQIEQSVERLRQTRLFGDVRVSLVEPEGPESPYRDVLVEVKERNTGAINFGVAVGSDTGAFGEFSITQSNFDITDFPASFEEFITGRAFRGGGQRFSMVLRPGDELFQYSMSLTEPHFMESDVSLSVAGSYYEREFDKYDEERISFNFRLGRRLGDVWDLGLTGRVEEVRLSSFDPDSPTEVFQDAGPDVVTAVGVGLTRTTVGTVTRPGRGSRLEVSFEQIGAMGGDFDFSKASAEYTVFLTLDEDFIGRKSILKLNSRLGYIFGGGRVPTYERFYLGGRSLRGFDFREVGPKGIRADNGLPSEEPVGGTWLIFGGAQYEFPLVAESVAGVVFVDSGTVSSDVSVDEYRLSVGGGLRLYIPQLGPVPIALDFAYPVLKEDFDDTRIFSFSAELPF